MLMPAEMQAKKNRLEKGGFFMTVLKSARDFCGSGRARETGDAVDGTGFAGVRGHARSHSDRIRI